MFHWSHISSDVSFQRQYGCLSAGRQLGWEWIIDLVQWEEDWILDWYWLRENSLPSCTWIQSENKTTVALLKIKWSIPYWIYVFRKKGKGNFKKMVRIKKRKPRKEKRTLQNKWKYNSSHLLCAKYLGLAVLGDSIAVCKMVLYRRRGIPRNWKFYRCWSCDLMTLFSGIPRTIFIFVSGIAESIILWINHLIAVYKLWPSPVVFDSVTRESHHEYTQKLRQTQTKFADSIVLWITV